MSCQYQGLCGGCIYRDLPETKYREEKVAKLQSILQRLSAQEYRFNEPFFVGDGQRRRAAFAFSYKKGKLVLGYNQKQSAEIVDIENCPLLTAKLNACLPAVKELILKLCQIKIPQKKKNKVIGYENLHTGDVLLTQADNGIDMVLEFEKDITLDYQMEISDFIQNREDIIRISHRKNEFAEAQTLLEKAKPYIKNSGYDVYISAGTFLQASKISEQKMIDLVMGYLPQGKLSIADLFCGIGTFSYPMSQNKEHKIVAIDSSKSLLAGFQQSINKNQIANIEIKEKNLFKYPLSAKELEAFDVVVFDPPRAGALAQVKEIAAMDEAKMPQRIIAVSCNPHSFVQDAEILLSCGYKLKEITMIDQFSYSNHSELVALFTK